MKRLTVKWIIFYFFGYYVIFFLTFLEQPVKSVKKNEKTFFDQPVG